jgi:hypothetical protein
LFWRAAAIKLVQLLFRFPTPNWFVVRALHATQLAGTAQQIANSVCRAIGKLCDYA